MSLGEKEMCLKNMGRKPPLPYPLKESTGGDGIAYQEYDIPEEKRADVLRQLYPMGTPPAMDTPFLDIHEMRLFVLKDFRVLRYRESNLLASPYFDHSGGLFVDWQPLDTLTSPFFIQQMAVFNGQAINKDEEDEQ